MYKTAESVSPKHPDKMCDQISDAILDACLRDDPLSRAAIEVMWWHGIVTVTGELTTKSYVNPRPIVDRIVGEHLGVQTNIVRQSPEIARWVDSWWAGDQGIMVGYACRETDAYMPLEYELARLLNEHIFSLHPHDGKTQVTLLDGVLVTVVCSWCHVSTQELGTIIDSFLSENSLFQSVIWWDYEKVINPAGDWDVGGFAADTGLTGRKLAVDNYGPRVPLGGGCFSGKEPMKVDRSAAYMARKLAVELLEKKWASEIYVQLAYAIWRVAPVSATALIDGLSEDLDIYDDRLTPEGIIQVLDLRQPIYEATSRYGHFGRGFVWG